MEIIPENNTVLCEQVNKIKHRVEESGICYEKEEFPVYRILSVCDGEKIWKPGDEIICESTGTRLDFSGNVRYLFKIENIAGKTIDKMIDKIQICKTRKVKTPVRGTSVAAGLDFFVPEDLTIEDMNKMFEKTNHAVLYKYNSAGYVTKICLKPGQSACIPSGIKAKLPHGYCMEFHNKSGIACKKSLLAGSCLIDEDYQGEWHIDVHNVSSTNVAEICAGDKIAQFVMYKVEYPAVEVVDSEKTLFGDVNSERGDGAFGSTGTN